MGIMNHQKVLEYINEVCSHIKNKKVHEEIKLEITGHIEEIASDLVDSGETEDIAIEKAVNQMGDAEIVGRQLHKIHKPEPEWSVLAITILFSGLGLILMYLIESKGALPYNDQIFRRTAISTFIGLLAAGGFYFFDYRRLLVYSKYIYIGTILALIFVVFRGSTWLGIGTIYTNLMTPSPLLSIIALSGLYDRLDWKDSYKIFTGLVLGITPAILMLAAHSFASCFTYLFSLVTILVVSKINLKYIFGSAILAGSFILSILFKAPYRMERFLIFLDPNRDQNGVGWIYKQLSKLIHLGGFWGQGFNLDPRSSTSVPSVNSEFIFTYIVYTFGWIAGIVLAIFIAAFLIRTARIAVMTKNSYGKLLVSGFVAFFSVQFVWNALMNLSLAPTLGISLPFISFGGSQFVTNMIAVGIILNVYKNRSLSKPLTA